MPAKAIDCIALQHTAIDQTHQEFVALLEATRAAQGAEFARRFAELLAHTRQHFAAEEQMMQDSACPTFGEHRADHQRILGDMDRFNARVAAGRAAMARAWLDESLPDWFNTHLRTMDAALASHLAA